MKLARRIATGFAALLAIYISICVGGRLVYRKILYPIPVGGESLPPELGVVRTLTAGDGQLVHVYDVEGRPTARTVVFFHGNGETIGNGVYLAENMQARGFSVRLVEYRGYGLSRAGSPTEAGIYADAQAALADLAAHGVGPDRVALWGSSLGTGVAVEMARRRLGSRLVLVSPYTSIAEIAATKVRWLPVSLIVGDRYDTIGKACDLSTPTLVVHGDQDEFIPASQGRAVASAISGARFMLLRGAHHDDVYTVGGAALLDEIAAFLR